MINPTTSSTENENPPSEAWPGRPADPESPQDASGRRIEAIARARLFGEPAQPWAEPSVSGASAPFDKALVATAVADLGGSAPSTDLRRGTLVDRYVVLSKLGAGGMGVVFAAYDPELDRKVALKLLHPRLAEDVARAATHEAQARLVREAQALARLNHPNIVAVHDVGEHRGAVWLAMEYVDGETLSAWLKRRRHTWREVLAVLTPAAQGLAAAHRGGLVHRDIKPDNIMLGADGRVRVMDLGLVRALGGDGQTVRAPASTIASGAALVETVVVEVTRDGAVMGTPAYMSPEQYRGLPIDARSDVFSFCVTLWESLMGERPFAGDTLLELATYVLSGTVRSAPRDAHARSVPGWLRRACLRGLAVEPGHRFASMHALLDALANGRARSRTRKWTLGAVAAASLGASAALYQHHDRAERIVACEQAGDSILEVWSDETRAGVRAGILATGLAYAPVTADKVMPFLDAQAGAWREHRAEACRMADIEGTLDAEQFDRAVWCLDERRMELEALLTALTGADARVVQNAVTAAAVLSPVSPCTDQQVLAALPPPPADRRAAADAVRVMLSQARTLLWAGELSEALRRTRSALAQAEALGWPPMAAAARQLEGACLDATGAYAEAEAASVAAYMEAAKVRAWGVAASAAQELMFTVGYRQTRHAEGAVWAGHAEVAISLAGDPLGLREASRLNNLAIIRLEAGAYTPAKTLHERALAIREEMLGADHPDVAVSLTNLANVHAAMGAYSEAKTLHERALAIESNTLGADHPAVADTLNNLANMHADMGAYAEAKALHKRALAIRERSLGPDHRDVAASVSNLAVLYENMGAYVEAKALHRRVLTIREGTLDPNHLEIAASLHSLAMVHQATGEYAEAKALNERALAIRERVLGPDHRDMAASLNNLATIAQATGRYSEAKALLERVRAIMEKALGPEHPDVAASLHNLAIVHQAAGEHAEARMLYERALNIKEKAFGPDNVQVAQSLNNLASILESSGAHDEAKALHERALVIWEKELGLRHPYVAVSLGGLGGLALRRGRTTEAVALLKRAVTIYDAHEGVQIGEPEIRFSLAKALVRAGRDRARALAEARKADDGYRGLGEGAAKELAEIKTFLARHGDSVSK